MSYLTEKQANVLAFLRQFFQQEDRMPSTHEVGRHFGIFQTAAYSHLRALEKKGEIEARSEGNRTWYRFTRQTTKDQ